MGFATRDLPEDLPESVIWWQIAARGFNDLQEAVKTEIARISLFIRHFMRFEGGLNGAKGGD